MPGPGRRSVASCVVWLADVDQAPDPSRRVIQHHLQKARLAAGSNSYIAVVYLGHGIQEPPTEAGELWCYDRSFDESSADGTGPSE
jgi:regulator-associated protein of mTOR